LQEVVVEVAVVANLIKEVEVAVQVDIAPDFRL
jgi:hypothetical protein